MKPEAYLAQKGCTCIDRVIDDIHQATVFNDSLQPGLATVLAGENSDLMAALKQTVDLVQDECFR